MLSAATNRVLTEVGPGTRMGGYLRRYWHPIAAESEFREPGVRAIRVLGEDLVLYRDLSGGFGMIERRCPHRGADLAYAFVEDCGLRCNYHGWLFGADGQCLARPYEDVSHPARRRGGRVGIKSYPVRAHAGLLWVYLGSQSPPLIPDWEPFSWKNGFVQVFFAELPCNWLQCQENALDPVHFEWMHLNWSVRQSGRTGPYSPRHLRIDFEETEYGFIYKRVTENSSEADESWATGRVMLWPTGFYAGEHFDWHTPVDDRTTLRVTWAFARVPREKEPYEQPLPIPAWRGPIKDDSGRWLCERPSNQDFVAMVGQGQIADRTREHLGASDRGVVMMRKRFLAELEAVAVGCDPKALWSDPAWNRRIPLPCIHKDVFVNGLTREEMLAHPGVNSILRAYPFQAGEPPEVRAAFEAALGLEGAQDPAVASGRQT
jgi:5,5'-dehydrodivanillate O-demethylase